MSGFLTHSPADVLVKILQDRALPKLSAWEIVVDQEPDVPDNVITIEDTQGRDDGRTMNEGERQIHHGIIVRVRSITKPKGQKLASYLATYLDQNILDANASLLDPDDNTVTCYYNVQSISRTTDVISLGKEMPTSRRSLFTINAVMAIRQVLLNGS